MFNTIVSNNMYLQTERIENWSTNCSTETYAVNIYTTFAKITFYERYNVVARFCFI